MDDLRSVFRETVALIRDRFWSQNGVFFTEKYSSEDWSFNVCNPHEAFMDIQKNHGVIKPCVSRFYTSSSVTLLPSLRNEFVFLFYVALFGMESFGVKGLKCFLLCINVQYSIEFLRFLCSPEAISELKSEWIHVYEESFIDAHLLKPLEKWRPVFMNLEKTLGSKQNKLQHKKVTEVQPFKLTQPRPRSILIPEIEIPKMEKMREPPNSTYTQPPEVSLLLVKKEKNREYIEKLKAESDRLKPRCAEPIVKSVKHVSSTDDLDLNGDNYAMITTKEENADNTGSNKKKKLKCKNYVNALNTSTVINTNAVTILREWKLYLDKEKEQRKKLTELESGAFTNAAYMAWKTEEEAKIKLNQLKQIERNRLNAMISHEASSIAKHNLYCERRNNVNQLKNEKNQKLMELVKAKKLQQATMNQIAKEIASTHENAKIAKKKVMKEKRKLAAEIAKESKLLLNEAYKKAEEEKKMKKELIAKIQAEESSAIMTKSLNTKQIDLADTPGYGLLNEMSIVELRERLDQLKLKKQRELEEKRDAIQSLKEQKTKVLSEALNRISKHRSVKTVAAVGATLTNIQNASTNNNHTFTKEDIYKSDPLLQQMIDHLTKQKEERWRQLNGDQSLALRKYINKGVKRREEKPFKTFWDEMERSREMKSRAEMGATHHPSEHLITSLTV